MKGADDMGEKHLYKSKTNKMVNGVCAGIGEYFNIDPTLIRLVAAFGACMSCGTVGVAYVIAMIIIPEEA